MHLNNFHSLTVTDGGQTWSSFDTENNTKVLSSKWYCLYNIKITEEDDRKQAYPQIKVQTNFWHDLDNLKDSSELFVLVLSAESKH